MTIENLKLSNMEEISAAVEALLFVYGEPIDAKRLAKIINTDKDVVNEALRWLENKYSAKSSGLKIIFSDERAQLATKPEFSYLLENFISEEFKENLTPAALETLSLIAYFGPLSRLKIDYFRGVNSSFILRNLLMRGLIERSESSTRAYLYQLSFDTLKYLGISKVGELPEYEKYKELFQNFQNES